MPTGPADIYFTKALHTTRTSSIVATWWFRRKQKNGLKNGHPELEENKGNLGSLFNDVLVTNSIKVQQSQPVSKMNVIAIKFYSSL